MDRLARTAGITEENMRVLTLARRNMRAALKYRKEQQSS